MQDYTVRQLLQALSDAEAKQKVAVKGKRWDSSVRIAQRQIRLAIELEMKTRGSD
jgi:hypothetical protein